MSTTLALRVLLALSIVSSTLALPAPSVKPTVVNNSGIKIPFVRRSNFTGVNLLKADQARAKALKTRKFSKGTKFDKHSALSAANQIGIDITNTAVTYVAEVNVGTPPQTFNLIVDTGSSNTWVGASVPYVPASGVDTGNEVFVSYGSGVFFGEEFIDSLTVGDLVIPQQSLGAAEFAFGFNGVDGILGIGPGDLTVGTTSDGNAVPTVTENAFSLGLINTQSVTVSFAPTNSLSETNGEIMFGGLDASKLNSVMTFVPITENFPASQYVGIDQTITMNGQTILDTSGIVDTGTTLTLIASDALATYVAAVGAVFDPNVGLYSITTDQFANLQSLFFNIGGRSFEFTPNAQIFPRTLNTALGGSEDLAYLILGDIGEVSGTGLDFINGMVFLERFYTLFDSQHGLFGIATTPFTFAETN